MGKVEREWRQCLQVAMPLLPMMLGPLDRHTRNRLLTPVNYRTESSDPPESIEWRGTRGLQGVCGPSKQAQDWSLKAFPLVPPATSDKIKGDINSTMLAAPNSV